MAWQLPIKFAIAEYIVHRGSRQHIFKKHWLNMIFTSTLFVVIIVMSDFLESYQTRYKSSPQSSDVLLILSLMSMLTMVRFSLIDPCLMETWDPVAAVFGWLDQNCDDDLVASCDRTGFVPFWSCLKNNFNELKCSTLATVSTLKSKLSFSSRSTSKGILLPQRLRKNIEN